MTRAEAANALVEMIVAYKGVNKWDIKQKYIEAVSVACGVLLVDDVLKTNPIPPEEPSEPKTMSLNEWINYNKQKDGLL